MKMNAAIPMVADSKHSDGPINVSRIGNVRLTRKFAIQFAAVEISAARARARLGKISEIINHTRGPNENAKQTM